jgi:xanthine dehydrogenase YagT iron-sulfur-binding subunit
MKGGCLVSSSKKPDNPNTSSTGFSRRGFIRGVGIGGGALGSGALEETAAAAPAAVLGPAAVPVTLQINGKPHKLNVEPRVTLLDALREHLDMTGAKRVCDRSTCGSCTVIMGGKVVYACSVLAIDAQGKNIETIEGMNADGKLGAIPTAFVNNDGQQCGYCTPGFVMAVKGLLAKHPNPNPQLVNEELGGNLCRCGTYMGVRKAVLEAARTTKGGKNG